MNSIVEAHKNETSRSPLPTDAERHALEQSGPLLRYASENIKDLDPDLSLAIAECAAAEKSQAWTPQTSQRFWKAFNELNELIQPATMDCLQATHKNILRRFHLFFWRSPVNESLGERSTRQYMALLITLLIIVVPLQLLIWVYTNLATEIERNAVDLTTAGVGFSTRCAALAHSVNEPAGKEHVWTPDEAAKWDGLVAESTDIRNKAAQLLDSSWFLSKLSLSSRKDSSPILPVALIDLDCTNVVDPVSAATLRASASVAGARLLSSIFFQFLLPILLGTIGALAYVLRNVSDRIRQSTFSTTSPIRNLVRIILGALMGVVIGLFSGGLSSQLSLPPLAMAFLAGYGVEGVFTVFDGFINKLRSDSNVTTTAK